MHCFLSNLDVLSISAKKDTLNLSFGSPKTCVSRCFLLTQRQQTLNFPKHRQWRQQASQLAVPATCSLHMMGSETSGVPTVKFPETFTNLQESNLPILGYTHSHSQMGKCTPLKFHMEPENGELEDDFPFQFGDFLGSMVNFRGVDIFLLRYFCVTLGIQVLRPTSTVHGLWRCKN